MAEELYAFGEDDALFILEGARDSFRQRSEPKIRTLEDHFYDDRPQFSEIVTVHVTDDPPVNGRYVGVLQNLTNGDKEEDPVWEDMSDGTEDGAVIVEVIPAPGMDELSEGDYSCLVVSQTDPAEPDPDSDDLWEAPKLVVMALSGAAATGIIGFAHVVNVYSGMTLIGWKLVEIDFNTGAPHVPIEMVDGRIWTNAYEDSLRPSWPGTPKMRDNHGDPVTHIVPVYQSAKDKLLDRVNIVFDGYPSQDSVTVVKTVAPPVCNGDNTISQDITYGTLTGIAPGVIGFQLNLS